MTADGGPEMYGDWMLRGLLAYEAELAAGRTAEQAREAVRPPRGQFLIYCGLLDQLAMAWPPLGPGVGGLGEEGDAAPAG